ncbi:MAG: hypothetical protein FJ291_28630 [Planctomycetes bacterium]|nr:hypothetical protein [Planctomycetota bacterium]
MPVKTITIDLEAYDLLAADKHDGESFSKVIKRRFRPKNTARNLYEHLHEIALEEETLENIEKVIASRKDFLTETPPLDAEE